MSLPLFLRFFPLVFLFVTITCHSQIETVFSANGYSFSGVDKNNGDNLRYTLRQGSNTSIYNFDLNSGNYDSILVDAYQLQQVKFTDDLMFYITFDYLTNGNDGMHTLNVLDTTGNLITPVDINEYFQSNSDRYKPKFGTICNDRYYVNGYFNGFHCIWESDGTTNGTYPIFESVDPIVAINTLNDTLFIATEDDFNYQFHYYALNQTVQNYSSISKDNFTSYFDSCGESDAHFYFNARDSINNRFIYRSNFVAPPEEFMQGTIANITFQSDSFLIVTSEPSHIYSRKLFRGSLTDPLSSLSEIPFQSSIDSPNMRLDLSYGGKYYRTRSFENGIELVKINDEDSLEFIQTNAYGPNSGIIIREEGFVQYEFFQPPRFHIDANNIAYGVLTNGLDSNFYMYRIDDTNEQSLFKLDHPDHVESIFTHNGYIYWFEVLEGIISLKRRSLSLANEEQLAITNDSETWFRQFAVSYKSDVINTENLRPNLKGVKFDSEGNTYFGFIADNWVTAVHFISSDTNKIFETRGSNVFVKYDRQGNYQWANGIGYTHGAFFNEAEFAIRPNGNLVTLGHFFQIAYFDDDSLTAPRAGFFLAELDANTGQVVWKNKFAEMFYGNDIYLDGIELDEDGNIYIAFTYKEFAVNVDGITLHSEKSPVNALAKFDSGGNVIWAKNIETPWLDFYGRTRSMDYNSEFQTLTTVQSMGYFNVSSSCGYHEFDYYIQELDKEGNILNQHEFTGSDLGSLTVGTRTPDNQFFGKGYHRGTITMDHFSSTTNISPGDCNDTEGFGLVYDGDLNEIIKATEANETSLIPFDISKTEQNIYVYGVNKEEELTLLKYSNQGELISFKKLNQFSDPFDWLGHRNYFDITDEHIVIVGRNFRKDPSNDVIPLLNASPSISVLKIDNDDWTPADDWIQQIPVEITIDEDFIIYPNPFNDKVEILFSGIEATFDRYQISDALGRLIQSGELGELPHQIIELSELRSGMYVITLFTENQKSAQQLIKF